MDAYVRASLKKFSKKRYDKIFCGNIEMSHFCFVA